MSDAPAGRLTDLEWSDKDFEHYMDAYQTVIQVKPGQTLTAAQVDDIRFVDNWHRREEETLPEAYARGFSDGRRHAAGADLAKLMEALDEAQMEAATQRGLTRFYSQALSRLQGT